MKHHAPTYLLIVTLLTGSLAQAQTVSQSSAPPTRPATVTASSVCGGSPTYDQLTAAEQTPVPSQIIQFGTSPIELTISAMEFDDKPVDPARASSTDLCWRSTLWVGVNVSTTGEVASFMKGKGSFRGGGGGKLAPTTSPAFSL